MALIPAMGGSNGKELKSQFFSETTTSASNVSLPNAGADKIVVGVKFTSATYIGMLFYGTSTNAWSCKVKTASFADVPNTNVIGYYYYYDA